MAVAAAVVVFSVAACGSESTSEDGAGSAAPTGLPETTTQLSEMATQSPADTAQITATQTASTVEQADDSDWRVPTTLWGLPAASSGLRLPDAVNSAYSYRVNQVTDDYGSAVVTRAGLMVLSSEEVALLGPDGAPLWTIPTPTDGFSQEIPRHLALLATGDGTPYLEWTSPDGYGFEFAEIHEDGSLSESVSFKIDENDGAEYYDSRSALGGFALAGTDREGQEFVDLIDPLTGQLKSRVTGDEVAIVELPYGGTVTDVVARLAGNTLEIVGNAGQPLTSAIDVSDVDLDVSGYSDEDGLRLLSFNPESVIVGDGEKGLQIGAAGIVWTVNPGIGPITMAAELGDGSWVFGGWGVAQYSAGEDEPTWMTAFERWDLSGTLTAPSDKLLAISSYRGAKLLDAETGSILEEWEDGADIEFLPIGSTLVAMQETGQEHILRYFSLDGELVTEIRETTTAPFSHARPIDGGWAIMDLYDDYSEFRVFLGN